MLVGLNNTGHPVPDEICDIGLFDSSSREEVILEWTTSLDTSSQHFICVSGDVSSGIYRPPQLLPQFYLQLVPTRFFLFAVGSHTVIIYFGWLGLALYNIVVRIMVRVDVRVRVTQG